MDSRTTRIIRAIAKDGEGEALLDDFTAYAEQRLALKHGYTDANSFLLAAQRVYAHRAAVAEQFGIQPSELLDL